MKIFFILLSISSLTLLFSCGSQQRIDHRLDRKKGHVVEQLQDFAISCPKGVLLDGYFEHKKVYWIHASIEDVWQAYTGVSPHDMWSGPTNKFKKAFSTWDGNGFTRRESNIPTPNEGMVYELKLKITKFLKIPVSFEITELSETKHLIEFTYGMENKSKGKQILKFVAFDKGTYIIHSSYFSSGNNIRDKYLYPFFHEKCVDEFHHQMKKIIYGLEK